MAVPSVRWPRPVRAGAGFQVVGTSVRAGAQASVVSAASVVASAGASSAAGASGASSAGAASSAAGASSAAAGVPAPPARIEGSCCGLRLQGAGEPGGLGERGVEEVDGLAERREHRAGHLAQEHLARLEVGQLGDLLRVEGLAVQDATLDDQGGVRLGKVTQTLRRLDHVALDEGDGGRAGEEVVEAFDAHLGGGDLGQRVLDHGVVGVLTEGAPQVLQLLHGETAVLGQHSACGTVERLNDLRDGGLLYLPAPWVSFRTGRPPLRRARERRTPRAQGSGRGTRSRDRGSALTPAQAVRFAEPSVELLMRHDNRRSLVSSGKTTGPVPTRQIGHLPSVSPAGGSGDRPARRRCPRPPR